jgi:hypothetical protein
MARRVERLMDDDVRPLRYTVNEQSLLILLLDHGPGSQRYTPMKFTEERALEASLGFEKIEVRLSKQAPHGKLQSNFPFP